MDKTYKVTGTFEVRVTMDETLVPDDAYRRDFYDHNTPEDLAGHIAYTLLQGFDYVEGLTPEQHKLIRWLDKQIEIEDVTLSIR